MVSCRMLQAALMHAGRVILFEKQDKHHHCMIIINNNNNRIGAVVSAPSGTRSRQAGCTSLLGAPYIHNGVAPTAIADPH